MGALEDAIAFLEQNLMGCRKAQMKHSTKIRPTMEAPIDLAQAVRQARSKTTNDETPQTRNALVQAVRTIYHSEASEAEAFLSPSTVDEVALFELARQSQELAPALDALRKVALDRSVFQQL